MRPPTSGGSARTGSLFCLLILLLCGGCGLLRRPPPAVDRSQDPRILEEIHARLAAEPAIDRAQIRIEVDGAVVVLYGSVNGIAAWQCAIRNAQLVTGVVTVVDYLVIERGPREVPCGARPGSSRSSGP